MKIAVLDTGVNLLHPEFKNNNIVCKKIEKNITTELFGNSDMIGHGTAVCGIIAKHSPTSEITMYKIFDNEDHISDEELVEVLSYILLHEKFDIICLCLGINMTDKICRLEEICKSLVENGTVIVASFSNYGGVSYPAAFENVIGVDWDISCNLDDDLIFCQNGIVNVYGKGRNQKLCWSGNTDYIINCGASFATAHVVGFLAASVKKNQTWNYNRAINNIEKGAKKTFKINNSSELVRYNEINYGRVAVFPLSKEIKALLKFSEYVCGEIKCVFDIRQSGKMGIDVSEDSYINCNIENLFVKDIDEIDLYNDKIDTLVVGHLGEINRITGKNYTKRCIDYCIENKKTFVSFDTILPVIKEKFKSENIDCYSINIENIEFDPSEKLFSIGKPIVSVMGTSSQQGKFTLQMELRKLFQKNGYQVGQWTSEPQGALLSSNQVFPTGYNSNISFSEKQIISYINYQLHDIEKTNPDIILTGTQSFVLHENLYNTHTYPYSQSAIIAGLAPDAVVLVFNYFDDRSYVLRTIQYIESWTNANVVCVVLSFKKRVSTWSPTEIRNLELSKAEIETYLLEYSKIIQKPCYYINDVEKIYNELLSFFS